MPGFFVTFEGMEGVGKTTQVQKAFDLLKVKHPGNVVVTREPGGTPSGEAIRNVMLQAGRGSIDGMAEPQRELFYSHQPDNDRNGIDGLTEMLLVFAARHLHLRDVIKPSLKAGKIVLCDRFTDATFAYQGGGRGVDDKRIMLLQDMVQGTLRPDLTLLLDAPVELGLARARERSELDRMEAETLNFFRRVRDKYLDLSRQDPNRIHVIDAARGVDEVAWDLRTILQERGLC